MAKRRANGEGNIRKRKDGRWEGRYTAGRDPETGKAIYKNVLGKTQAEVKEKLKQAIAASQQLDVHRVKTYTVESWLKLWYETYERPKSDFSTAVDNQLCSRSPMTKSIKLPRDETRVEKRAFTQEQYNMAYQFAKEWEDGLSIMVMLETGVSRSELLGLRWSDLDEENQCIQIREGLVVYHSVEQDKQVMEKSGLKNKFRRRSIPITDDDLWERLLQAPRTVTMGKRTILTEEIFHSPEGKPYQPNNWENRVFRRFMRELRTIHPEIPALSPHELRHTRATLWIAQGMDPYMAARLLGHSDLKMLTKETAR